jgi:stage II sporulation protein D
MRKALLLILASLSYATHQETERDTPPEGAKPATIRVLLDKETEGALVEVRGPFKVYDPKTGKQLSGGKAKRFYLFPHEEGIKWGEDFLGTYQLRIAPIEGETTIFVNGLQYHGCLDVFHVRDKVTIVNEVAIEEYIKSILTPQFERFYGTTVMESVAIVARTNAYHQVTTSKESFWHVESSAMGYNGLGATGINHEMEQAVDSTRYLVMTLEELPFAAAWTENCAGKTARYDAIFRKNVASAVGIDAAFAQKARAEHHWSFSVERDKIAKIAKTNRVTGLELFIENESKKVYAIRVQDGTRHQDLDFFALQEGLGKETLLSNDFTVSLQGKLAIFDGYGSGCGVGLCLYSAGHMSKKGDDAPSILATFFPFTHLEKIPSHPDPALSSNTNRCIIPRRIPQLQEEDYGTDPVPEES